MHRRILFGVVAWLLGAATATAGSLLAVSLLGQGITGTSGALLTQDAVDRALASASAESSATDDLPSPAASAAASARSPSARAATDTPTPSAPASGTGATAPTPSASSSSPAPHGTPSGDGTVLTSRGGDVVASCPAAGTYLDSWSPAQGYVADDVRRGPAPTARVTFESSSGSEVTMVVSCSGGIPSAHTSYDE